MALTPNFACDKCGTIDSIFATHQDQLGQGYLCAKCKTGVWHDEFPAETEEENPDHGPLMNRVNTDDDDGFPSFS